MGSPRTPGVRPVRENHRRSRQVGRQGCRGATGSQVARLGFAVRREPRTFGGLRSTEGLNPWQQRKLAAASSSAQRPLRTCDPASSMEQAPKPRPDMVRPVNGVWRIQWKRKK